MRFDDLCELYEEKDVKAGNPDLNAALKPVQDFLIFIKSLVQDGIAAFHEDDMKKAADKMLDEVKPLLKDFEAEAVRQYAKDVVRLATSGERGVFGMDAGPYDAEINSGKPKVFPNFLSHSRSAVNGMKPQW